MVNQATTDSEGPMVHLKQILLERIEEICTPTLYQMPSMHQTQHQNTTAEK